ncbi:MAG: hypothetical protein ACYDHB_00755 [Candidatus Dormibacteria bacterium]
MTDAELDAIRELDRDPPSWVSLCSEPERAALAWNWAVGSGKDYRLSLTQTSLGRPRWLSVQVASQMRPVPVAYVVAALGASMMVLAEEASTDSDTHSRLRAVTEERLLGLLGMDPESQWLGEEWSRDSGESSTLSASSIERRSTDDTESGLVIVPGTRHAFLFVAVTALTSEALNSRLNKLTERLAALGTDGLDRIGLPDAGTMVVHRLLVVGGPYHLRESRRAGIVTLHIEELAQLFLETGAAGFDPDLTWQFLDELATMPGIADTVPLDLDDIWHAWLARGVLNPTGQREISLAIDPHSNYPAWKLAAAFEPSEEVLAALNLPPIPEWSVARLDADGQVTLRAGHSLAVVKPVPPLVFLTQAAGPLEAVGIDPSFALGLADGVGLTATHFPEVGKLLTGNYESPLLVAITFETRRGTVTGDREGLIRTEAQQAPIHSVSITLGAAWLQLLATSPKDAHEMIGEALTRVLRPRDSQTANPLPESADTRFLKAWCEAPPIALLGFYQDTLLLPMKDQYRLPRGLPTRARARRLLAAAVIERGIGPGTYFGEDAIRFCRERLMPIVNELLQATVAQWSSESLLILADQVNDAHAERFRSSAELGRALAAPWAAQWRQIASTVEGSPELTGPIDALLEMFCAFEPKGPLLPDRFDIAEACDVVNLSIQIGLTLENAVRRLCPIVARVDAAGPVDVVAWSGQTSPDFESQIQPNGELGPVDLQAFAEQRYQDHVRSLGTGDTESVGGVVGDVTPWRETDFVRLSDLDPPGHLHEADRELRLTCGFGLDGMFAVMGTAVTAGHSSGRVVVTARSELEAAAHEWSGLPRDEIAAAVQHLTLSPELVRRHGLNYWQYKERDQRVLVRPLIPVGGDLLLMPWLVRAAQEVFALYLLDGTLPWAAASTPASVRDAFTRYRQAGNRDLEREATRVAAQLGLPHRANLRPEVARGVGLELPGEIDLLIVDPQRHRIWVCEVKDLAVSVSSRMIHQRLTRFFAQDGYIFKLTGKAAAVEANLIPTLSLLSVAESGPWRVLSLMVTRRVEAAGFVSQVPVPFVLVRDLKSILTSEADPPPGHYPVGDS